jgi:AcrR family transcriptional regulator
MTKSNARASDVAPGRKARDAAREARTEVYRQHILDAAERVFAERGYEAAKVAEIAQDCALSMGTIYAIFPGKAELYAALLEARGQELLRLARDLAALSLPPRQALLALAEVYIDYFVAHPAFLRMHLRSGASWALGPVTGAPAQVGTWREIHTLQADIFRRGVAAGDFVEEEPEYLARTFSAMDQVLLADWVAGGMGDDRDTLARRFRDMVERSFCLPPPAADRRGAGRRGDQPARRAEAARATPIRSP